MNQAVLVAILQMLLGFLQAVAYALLVWWSFGLLKKFPWDKYFEEPRPYHLLIPALALAGLAFVPIKFLLDLLFSFPLDFSKAWIPSLLKFFEGLGLLGLLVYLCLRFKISGDGSSGSGKFFRSRSLSLTAIIIIAVILAAAGGVYYYLSSQGYIVKFSLSKPKYLDYQNLSPRFSLSYPSKFVLDKDEESRFGKDYLIGLKLPSDNRVGCDVRAVKGQLNLEGELGAVAEKLAQQISEGAEEFQVLGSEFREIGGEKAVLLGISFKGPLGETMRTDQIFTSHGGNVYTLICGTTKDTFEFFAEDFSYFLDHFAWE